MAHRTTVVEVCAIIETDLKEEAVEPFIRTANLLVTEHLVSATPAINDDLLVEIETYLAAHFITLWDPRVKQEAAGGTSFTYEGMTGEGLSASKYGQMVKILDPSGKLATLDKPSRIAFIARVGNETDVENL